MVAEVQKEQSPEKACRGRIAAIVKPLQRREPDTAKVVRKTLGKLSAAGDAESLAYLQRLGMYQCVAAMNYQERYEQRNAILGRNVPATPDRTNPRLAAAKEEAIESLLDMQFGRGRLRDATYEEVQSAMTWHGRVADTNARVAALYAEILSHGEPGQTVGEFISDKLAERIKRKIYAGANGHGFGETEVASAAAPASNNGDGQNGQGSDESHEPSAVSRRRQHSKNRKHAA